jgi:hypothetical protein
MPDLDARPLGNATDFTESGLPNPDYLIPDP